MNESIHNNSHKLSSQQCQEQQALATKRAIIDGWISDLPQMLTIQSFSLTTAHPRRVQRQRSCESRGIMEAGDAQQPRRSKRAFTSPDRFEPPMPSTRQKISESPAKKHQLVAKQRGRPGKISQLRPPLGVGAPSTAASSYQEGFGSTILAAEGTLNTSASRASSPTRTRKDLENAVPTIICCEFDAGMAADIRKDVQSLREELMAAGRHRGVLPVSLRDTLFPHLDKWDQDNAYFGEFSCSKEEEDSVWMAIQEIRIDAKDCGEENKPEASWSHEVIRPLIKNALKYTPWQNRIKLELVEAVSISPSDLLPKDATGAPFKLKKVDCALFLKPDPSFSAKIKQKLIALPDKDRSINQTSADFIKNRPLIASFELERQTPGTDPLVQLGIWSAALAERLGKLQEQGETESKLMAMPVVSIVGHHWSVYYSYTTDKGERMLQGPDILGSTTDFVGIYSIMKAIQMIARYGVEVYMPWFEQHILDSGINANP